MIKYIFLALLLFQDALTAKNQSFLDGISFSKEQEQLIANNGMWLLVYRLVSENYDIISSADIIDIALLLKESGLKEELLLAQMKKNVKNGQRIFTAVQNAITSVERRIWYQQKINHLEASENKFIRKIKNLHLKNYQEDKIIKAYASCVVPFQNVQERQKYFTPLVSEEIKQKSLPGSISLSYQEPYMGHDSKKKAYYSLKKEAFKTARIHKLSDMEKMLMAKCVAEKSLYFFNFAKNPRLGSKKILSHYYHSKEKNFFMDKGICTNFVDVAYDFAQTLGLKTKIKHNKFHAYLLAFLDGNWFQVHIFNNFDRDYDFIKLTTAYSA